MKPLLLLFVLFSTLAKTIVQADVIKIGHVASFTTFPAAYFDGFSIDYEIVYGMQAAFDQATDRNELPGDSFQIVLRNVSGQNFGIGGPEFTDLIFNEGVLATAALNFGVAYAGLQVSAASSPATPIIGAISADPSTFYTESVSHAINYRSTFGEEGLQQLNLGLNSKMRCSSFAVVYFNETTVLALAENFRTLLNSKGISNYSFYPYDAPDGVPFDDHALERADTVMTSQGFAPSCIIMMADAGFTQLFAQAVGNHSAFKKRDTFIIAPSVGTLPQQAYAETARDLIYFISQYPHPLDTTWLLIQNFQAALFALEQRGGFQPNITGAYFIPQAFYSYNNLEGYAIGRFLVEIFKRTPKPYTRQGILDTVYNTALFRIDDVTLGPFRKECVGKRLTDGTTCFCNQGNKALWSAYLNGTGHIVPVEADPIRSESASVAFTEMSLDRCSFDTTTVLQPTTFLGPIDAFYSTEVFATLGETDFNDFIRDAGAYSNFGVQVLNFVTTGNVLRDNAGSMVWLQERMDFRFGFRPMELAELEFYLQRYRTIALIGGLHNFTESPRSDTLLMDHYRRGVYDVKDPSAVEFVRNKISLEPVIADYIHALTKFWNDVSIKEFSSHKKYLIAQNDEMMDLLTLSLHSFNTLTDDNFVIDSKAAELAASSSTSDEITELISWMKSKAEDSSVEKVMFIIASQNRLVVNNVTLFATSETYQEKAMLYVATPEERIGEAIGLGSVAPGTTWTQNNIFFASIFDAHWTAFGRGSESDSIVAGYWGIQALLGFFDFSWSRLRAYRHALILFRIQDNIFETITAQRFLDSVYSVGTISLFSESLGRFYDQECSEAINISNTPDRTCQCSKGPRSFYVLSGYDMATATNFSDLRTNFKYQMTTCGVEYTPLPPPPTDLTTEIIASAATVFVIALIVVVLCVFACLPKKRDVSAAPKDQTKPFTMVFTDIQSSTSLWARIPEKMAAAVDEHHEIIRKLIKKYKGYEVKTIGDSFMVAFTDTKRAVEFAVGIQYEFFNYEWGHNSIDEVYKQLAEEKAAEAAEAEEQQLDVMSPTLESGTPMSGIAAIPQIPVVTPMTVKSGPGSSGAANGKPSFDDATPGADGHSASKASGQSKVQVVTIDVPGKPRVWNGLRVRVGIHHGMGEIKFDQVSLGYDYYGTVVNTAARVEGVGHGGQVLMTKAAYDDISGGDEHNLSPIPETTVTNLGGQPLRGLDEDVVLYQVLPSGLALREFAALRLDVERDIETDDETSGSDLTKSNQSASQAEITPEILAERYARRWKGHQSFQGAYYQLLGNWNFTKAMFSTSADKKRKEYLENIAHKWRVQLKGSNDKKMTSKMLWERHLMQLVIKVTPTIEASNPRAANGYLGLQMPGGSKGSRQSRNSNANAQFILGTPNVPISNFDRVGSIKRGGGSSAGNGSPGSIGLNSQPGSRNNRQTKILKAAGDLPEQPTFAQTVSSTGNGSAKNSARGSNNNGNNNNFANSMEQIQRKSGGSELPIGAVATEESTITPRREATAEPLAFQSSDKLNAPPPTRNELSTTQPPENLARMDSEGQNNNISSRDASHLQADSPTPKVEDV